ncbi:B3 domain-containing protein At2g33720-like [Quercus robur]|uniref:B3 domain-containing protein At2g33720-like n=1 Tax=Quercus robur TaxID=38942 RepID=UPI0021621990|nr:B3 domain-containing protein At2g33720-like [Quercus robur]
MIPITQNLLQTLQNQNSQVSTDLALYSGFHTNKCNKEQAMVAITQNLLQALECQNTLVSTDLTLSCVFPNKCNASQEKEVSTALTLFDESWFSSNKRKTMQKDQYTTPPTTFISHNYSTVASNTQEESTSMTLSTNFSPWTIIKKLTASDIGSLSRLLVQQSLVRQHILPFFGTDSVAKIESNGLSVRAFDQDSNSDYELVFKKWPSSKSYVFNGKWHENFVARRELKVGDIIGLYWDPRPSKFNFCVLQRAPQMY